MTTSKGTLNRRSFNAAAALFASASLSSSALGYTSATVAADERLPMHFVYDTRISTRYADSILNRLVFEQRHSFSGDVGRLWFNTLDTLWATHRIATLGLTRHSELFVLSTLAAERAYTITETSESRDHVIWLLEPGHGHPAADSSVLT